MSINMRRGDARLPFGCLKSYKSFKPHCSSQHNTQRPPNTVTHIYLWFEWWLFAPEIAVCYRDVTHTTIDGLITSGSALQGFICWFDENLMCATQLINITLAKGQYSCIPSKMFPFASQKNMYTTIQIFGVSKSYFF